MVPVVSVANMMTILATDPNILVPILQQDHTISEHTVRDHTIKELSMRDHTIRDLTMRDHTTKDLIMMHHTIRDHTMRQHQVLGLIMVTAMNAIQLHGILVVITTLGIREPQDLQDPRDTWVNMEE